MKYNFKIGDISIESDEPIEVTTLKPDKDPSKVEVTFNQLKSLINIFEDRIFDLNRYSDEDIDKFESETSFKLSEDTKLYFKSIGAFRCGDFCVPKVDKIIDLTKEWKDTIATEDQKDKYVVIEADGGDYTLIDNSDIVYMYEGKTKETKTDNESIYTHICKHIMSKIVGEGCKY